MGIGDIVDGIFIQKYIDGNFYQVGGVSLDTGVYYVYNSFVKQWVKDLLIVHNNYNYNNYTYYGEKYKVLII